jgi:hypothetical protein
LKWDNITDDNYDAENDDAQGNSPGHSLSSDAPMLISDCQSSWYVLHENFQPPGASGA